MWLTLRTCLKVFNLTKQSNENGNVSPKDDKGAACCDARRSAQTKYAGWTTEVTFMMVCVLVTLTLLNFAGQSGATTPYAMVELPVHESSLT